MSEATQIILNLLWRVDDDDFSIRLGSATTTISTTIPQIRSAVVVIVIISAQRIRASPIRRTPDNEACLTRELASREREIVSATYTPSLSASSPKLATWMSNAPSAGGLGAATVPYSSGRRTYAVRNPRAAAALRSYS